MGSSNKRLLYKLIERAGGWENYLYQTLKDVCDEVDLSDVNDETVKAIEEARIVLEAYEECSKSVKEAETGMEKMGFKKASSVATTIFPGTEHLSNVSQDPIVAESSRVVDESRTVELSPPESNGREEITRVTVLLPAKESKLQPQELRGVVGIDPTIGDCQGMLPIPEGCQIVNRDKMRITTRTGAELGRPQMDGQVKESANVTGRIRIDGRFDLVFKDNKLGEAFIWYEVVREEKTKEQELKMISFLDANSKKWVSFVEGSVVQARAIMIKESKNQLLDTLVKECGMQIVSVAVLKRSEDNPEEIKTIPHILLQPGG
jgi:hypothetical protein